MIRAVIYCRCSTEEESQKDALAKQVEEAIACAESHGWLLVDKYIESKSGTTTKGRTEYNRLLNDMKENKFDIIVIKSQDRLMRNVAEWYHFLQILTAEQKRLYMYLEQKFYTPDDALITGIKAILAEEYSRELSKKINNAHQNRQKSNGSVILTPNAYGFRKCLDKSVELVEEEVKIKVHMYELVAAGYGTRTVATILRNEGITKRNGKFFDSTDILRIIKNPLNKGTVVMNKRHFDFDSKRTITIPKEEQFVYEGKIPATVSVELWEQANDQIRKRSQAMHRSEKKSTGKYTGKYPLSGKLVCGLCGQPYYRRTRIRPRDKAKIHEWKCKTFLEVGRTDPKLFRPQIRKVGLYKIDGCDNVHIEENRFFELLETVCEKDYIPDKDKIIGAIIKMLRIVIKEKDLKPELEKELQKREKLKSHISKLVDKLLDGVISDELYQTKQKQKQKEMDEVEERICELERQMEKGSALHNRLYQIEQKLREDKTISDATVASMLDEVKKIVIFPEYMELHLSYSTLLGMEEGDFLEKEAEDVLKIQYGNLFDYRKQQQEDLQAVVDIMIRNPKTTAKEIAEELGITTSGVQQRITKLRNQKRIKFIGKGGKGVWAVIKE